ncbi:MAG: aldo/keto reductase [Anaerolineae bacterium]|nr:aldo/keto reductase [Anaerolineae bacterium]
MGSTISLGATGIRISPLGIGTWAWGDSVWWGYGRKYTDEDIQAAFQAALAGGVNLFDTAEVYGLGRSERLLGRVIRATGHEVIVATKFFPFPWRLTGRSLFRALRGSLKRLGLSQVGLYQIHFPFPPVPIEAWMNALADAVEAGLVRSVGVSNYNAEQMQRAYDALARRGILLASNQVHYSLLQRKPERNGLMALCEQLGVTMIAYSPLGMGLLTGKYTPDKPPPGLRGQRSTREQLRRIQPLIGLLREIGQAHGDKTPSQVALNWVICKGAVPIPGAKNARQAADNAAALGWRLTEDEISALDAASERVSSPG